MATLYVNNYVHKCLCVDKVKKPAGVFRSSHTGV